MEGKGSEVSGGLLTDEFIESASNVLSSHRGGQSVKGAQAFFTPPPVAEFIARVLLGDDYGKEREPTVDPLGAGAGNLLLPFQKRFGIEIDRDHSRAAYAIILSDCQIVADLAGAIGLRGSRLVANPPFGLNWKFRGHTGRSALVAWDIFVSLLAHGGIGAMIVPAKDAAMLVSDHPRQIWATVEVPDMYPDLDVMCYILFIGETWSLMQRHTANVAALPGLVGQIRDTMPWTQDGEDEEFVKKFSILRSEFADRAKNHGRRRSCISIGGARKPVLSVYLSPFEQVRLAQCGKRDVLDRIKALNRQSAFIFGANPRDWKAVLSLASEGELEIGPEVHQAYEMVRHKCEAICAPLMKNASAIQGLSRLDTLDEILCIKSDKERGFEKGKRYPVSNCTTEIHEFMTRWKLSKKDDQPVEEDVMIERKAQRITIGGQDFIVGNEKENDVMVYIRDHFELPQVKTTDELFPEEFGFWKRRVWSVIERLDEVA